MEAGIERFGPLELARRLGVKHDSLTRWLKPNAEIPQDKLLALIDLLDEFAHK